MLYLFLKQEIYMSENINQDTVGLREVRVKKMRGFIAFAAGMAGVLFGLHIGVM